MTRSRTDLTLKTNMLKNMTVPDMVKAMKQLSLEENDSGQALARVELDQEQEASDPGLAIAEEQEEMDDAESMNLALSLERDREQLREIERWDAAPIVLPYIKESDSDSAIDSPLPEEQEDSDADSDVDSPIYEGQEAMDDSQELDWKRNVDTQRRQAQAMVREMEKVEADSENDQDLSTTADSSDYVATQEEEIITSGDSAF